jgi:uncharacterized protein DUF3306
MADDEQSREPLTLKRWSARKRAAGKEVAAESTSVAASPPSVPSVESANSAHEQSSLPPVESLTFDSDFTPFLKSDVDESLKRAALKKLLHDPRFNVMDGLDVYIDDYSKPDPIEPDVVRTLVQARYLFDPPKTRVTKEGYVEDVPPEDETVDEAAAKRDGEQAPPAIAQDEVRELPPPEVPIGVRDDEPSKT